METEEKPKNIQVETFAEDMTKAIESIGTEGGGLVKKIIHDEDEESDRKKLSPVSKRSQIFMLSSFVLVILAIGFIAFSYVLNQQASTTAVAPQYKPIIFTDQNQSIDVTDLNNEQIIEKTLAEINNTNIKIGGVSGIYFKENEKVIGFRNFLNKMEIGLDQTNLDSFDDNFLVGITNLPTVSDDPSIEKGEKNFFIILKVRSMTDVFNVLHFWEKNMFSDLGGFFNMKISADTKYLLTKDFEDGIIQNKNARILYDTDGKIVMMYVYVNDTSVVFTNSEKTIGEIIARLAASQIKK